MPKSSLTRKWNVTELRLARVIECRQEHSRFPEDKKLYCDIELDNGNRKKDVPFVSASIDENTGKIHGITYAPAIGQMVGVLHCQGFYENPLVCFPIPYPWGGGKNKKYLQKDYQNLLDNIDDVVVCQKSGSKAVLKDDGDIEIYPAENGNIYLHPKNPKETTEGAARENDEIKSETSDDLAFWTFITTLFATFNSHTHIFPATGGAPTSVPAPLLVTKPSSLTGKITSSSDKVKIGGDS